MLIKILQLADLKKNQKSIIQNLKSVLRFFGIQKIILNLFTFFGKFVVCCWRRDFHGSVAGKRCFDLSCDQKRFFCYPHPPSLPSVPLISCTDLTDLF